MRGLRHPSAALALALALTVAAALPAGRAAAEGAPGSAPPPAATPYTPRTIELAGLLPVQEGGRVKPLSTFAGFALLRMNGKRVYATAAGESLTPVHWILDCLLRPDRAVRERFFLVENDEVLDAAGLPHDGRNRRDRYAYADLVPAREEIFRRAREYDRVDPKERTPVQAQLLRLALNMREFEGLAGALDFARHAFPVDGVPGAAEIFAGVDRPGVAEILERRERLREAALRERGTGAGPDGPAGEAVMALMGSVMQATHDAGGLALIPPPEGTEREWLTVPAVVDRALRAGGDLTRQVRVVAGLQGVAAAGAGGDGGAVESAVEGLHREVSAMAAERGEYALVPLEVTFYRWDFFYRALQVFVLAFLLAALTWLWPGSVLLRRAVPAAVAAGFLLVTVGVTLRCVLRGRPPVSTLYETILFVTGVAVGAALVTEYLNRRRVAVAAAAFFGMLGMFLAGKFETHEAVDTMPNLVAVLDTNFWLATHVTVINIGYAAVLFSSVIAHAYLVPRMLGLRRSDGDYYRGTARMVYGLQAFGLVFSLVGTILGGIWANDSWGRFWGWDPKENGALMICLWGLILLHARMGGYVRDFGFAAGAVFGGMVVAFSWWGVNLLGIGLHSYGFTSGAMFGLLVFYSVEGLVLLAAGIHALVARSAPALPPGGPAATVQAKPARPPAPEPA